MEAASIAISKAGSGHHKPIVEEGKPSDATKESNSDGRTFLAVLKQSLEQSKRKKVIKFGNAEEEEKVEAPRKAKKKSMGGNRLDGSKFKVRADNAGEELKHFGGDEDKTRSRALDAPGEGLLQFAPAVNGTAQLADMVVSRNRREDDSAPIVRTNIDGKGKDNLTSIAPRIEVQDRRTRIAKVSPASQVRKFEHYSGRTGEDAEGEIRLENRPVKVNMEIEIPRGLEGREAPRSAAMEFARRLDGQVGNEIVRQIKIVLNRASAGELEINLKPENLGRVRVEIQLEDNHLRGKFFVESLAAREVFKGALDGLQTKLLESGFGTADLEMARDESSSNFRFNSGNSQDRKTGDAAPEFENPPLVNTFIELDDNLVNLVV